jgi:hypothetical protein
MRTWRILFLALLCLAACQPAFEIAAPDSTTVTLLFTKEMSGEQIRRALEQSFTLERGLLQVAGLSVTYDLKRYEAQRTLCKFTRSS